MSLFGNSVLAGSAGQGPSADLGDTIDQSLRFHSGAQLTRNLQTQFPGSFSATATCSAWFKFANTITDASARLVWRADNVGSKDRGMQIKGDGTIQLRGMQADGFPKDLDGRYRDPSAWYHIVQQSDGTNLKCWINNNLVYNDTTPWASGSNSFSDLFYITCNTELGNEIGYQLAEWNFLDGTAADPDEFARYNNDGVWVPTTPSFTAAQYGANGFRLTFDSSQTNAGIGEDSAPIGASGHTARNDFTASGFDTADISSSNTDNDVDFNDTPTSNYSTYNSLVNNDEPTFNQANLDADSFNNGIAWATQELPDEHLYCEFVRTAGDRFAAGVWDAEDKFEKGAANDNDYAFGIVYSEFGGNNSIYNESTTASQTGLTAYTTGDVLGVEWRGDLATRQVNFYINGTQVGTSENVAAGGRYYFGAHRAGGTTGPSVQVNFGQMPFAAAPTGVSNTTHGMQTNNLAEPTIKNGSDHFRALTGTGANILAIAQGTNTSGTNWNPDVDTGFTDGLWLIKDRDNSSTQHQLVDSVRGGSLTLQCPASGAETSYVAPSGNSVAWCWKAGGAAVSNTEGTITSSVSANTDAGFSILTYTGNGTNSTIGHGLTQAPEFVIIKSRDDGNDFVVGSNDIDNWGTALYLNSSQAKEVTNGTTFFNGTAPTDTVITVGSRGSVNPSGLDLVCYAWHSVPGYSAFGSYTGNGSTDGPFVYLGFRPAFVLIKATGSVENWRIHDSTRDVSNPAISTLAPNVTSEENVNTIWSIDILSNGFKLRNNSNNFNASGATYIYMTFAESPFGGENAAPATAR